MKFSFTVLSLIIVHNSVHFIKADKPCAPRNEKFGMVCVCNSTYCDEISKIQIQDPGSYVMYSSSANGLRFEKSTGELEKSEIKYDGRLHIQWISDILELLNLVKTSSAILTFDTSKQYQNIEGFGGAFTDSACSLYQKFSKETQQKIVMSYFSENGIEYNMGRVPIAGTDVSSRPYAYNESPENDLTLSNFSLSFEDYDYKIPLIKEAQRLATSEIFLIATAWSPPAWMKTNKNIIYGKLLPQYYQVWADYHVRFLEEYKKESISYWGLTTGNQPLNGFLHITPMNSMGWLPSEQAEWIEHHFGPTLKSKFSDVKLLALDDQRVNLFIWMEIMAKKTKALQFIDGMATHIYTNRFIPPNVVELTRNALPDKFLISTEGSYGNMDSIHVKPGSWDRAESYIQTILEDLNLGYVGWLDWNLMLDDQGGPNWCDNSIDASILASPNKDEFIKQPYFYAMGHFSKFIPRGSKRIQVDQYVGSRVENVAFLRPDGGIIVVLYNRLRRELEITVGGKGKGHVILKIPAKSIHSIIFW